MLNDSCTKVSPRSSCIGPCGAYELDDWCSHWFERREGEEQGRERGRLEAEYPNSRTANASPVLRHTLHRRPEAHQAPLIYTRPQFECRNNLRSWCSTYNYRSNTTAQSSTATHPRTPYPRTSTPPAAAGYGYGYNRRAHADNSTYVRVPP